MKRLQSLSCLIPSKQYKLKYVCFATAFVLATATPQRVRAQQSLVLFESSPTSLPDAPSEVAAQATPPQAPAPLSPAPLSPAPLSPAPLSTAPLSTAMITGEALDANDGLIPGAHITLLSHTNVELATTTSASDGTFTFHDLPAGIYRVKITVPGLEGFLSAEVNLHPGEHHEMLRIAMPIARASTSIDVVVTQDEIAAEQVQAQLQQRVLGVIPAFYTSFVWDAAPLPAKQKYHIAFRALTDPVEFAAIAAVAGIEQSRGIFSGYGDGPAGYGRRYGAAYGDAFIGRFIGSAILPSLFHQDPRYFYRGTGSVSTRALHAISSAVLTRSDKGSTARRQINFSRILGGMASGAISNLYHPDTDRGPKLIFSAAAIQLGGHAVNNLIREFLLKRVTHKIPTYANGKEETTKPTAPSSTPAAPATAPK